MEEIWKDIVGYEGLYQVSNLGRVKNNIKLLSTKVVSSGYPSVMLCKSGKSKRQRIHRLVLDAFVPNIENKPNGNHIDGDKSNNLLHNLEWVTVSENSKHAIKLGLLVMPNIRGVKNGRSKVTEQQVLEIRKMKSELGDNITYKKMGEIFGVSDNQISMICNRRHWTHI